MSYPLQLIERAYQLARSGECADIKSIVSRLKIERYESVEAHLRQPSLLRELRILIKASPVTPG